MEHSESDLAPSGKLKILIVDDDVTARRAITNVLHRANHETVEVADGQSALDAFGREQPDVVLLDVNMPTMDGYQVARRIRELTGSHDWVPIIFLSGETDTDAIVRGIEAGGDDYLSKPFHHEVLTAKIMAMQRIARMRKELLRVKAELEQANTKLQHLALVDSLTGIANRRYLDNYLSREWNRQLRFGRSLALVLIDVDHFKAYNDHYGHRQGDACLQKIARLLQNQLQRTSDLLARYGGEEFAVVLPELSLTRAWLFAETLRAGIQNAQISHAASPDTPCVTASLGVVSLVPDAKQNPSGLIELADRALYRAKANGRNRSEKSDIE